MSIDISNLKAGDMVTVTTFDKLTITGRLTEPGWGDATLYLGAYLIRYSDGRAVGEVQIQTHTPMPDWDKPEVFAVRDDEGDAWVRSGESWECIPHRDAVARISSALDYDFGPITPIANYIKENA